jgi:hypothetical protein
MIRQQPLRMPASLALRPGLNYHHEMIEKRYRARGNYNEKSDPTKIENAVSS